MIAESVIQDANTLALFARLCAKSNSSHENFEDFQVS